MMSCAFLKASSNSCVLPGITSRIAVSSINQIIQEKGLAIVSDTGELEEIVNAVIERNRKAVEDFQADKQAAVGAMIGQVMREIKGADPKTVRIMLIEKMRSYPEAIVSSRKSSFVSPKQKEAAKKKYRLLHR